jgi:uncharacterized protein YnzC (UPF0291/DUF896 family)
MICRILFWVVIIFILINPVYAQEMSPIIVETGLPTPSTVRSGEPFSITYRVKYTDIVIILEEQMKFNNLVLVSGAKNNASLQNVSGDAEVLNLDISKVTRLGSEEDGFINIQDFTYTFRIINEIKGPKIIPSFNFIWVEKRAGMTKEEAKQKQELKEFPTDEVGIMYVSTIVAPPSLNIRDQFYFKDFKSFSTIMLGLGYGNIFSCFLIGLVLLVKFFNKSEIKTNTIEKEQEADTENSKLFSEIIFIPFAKKARKDLLKELKRLIKLNRVYLTDSEKEKIRFLLRTLILAELRDDVKASMSNTEIYDYLNNLDNKQIKKLGQKYTLLKNLVLRAKEYEESFGFRVDSETNIKDELNQIINDVKKLAKSGLIKCWKS